MPPLFYQHFWNIADSNVTQAVLLWLNTCIHPELVNHTFLTLIPKTPNPEHAHKYQPISLCNVLYKIFSKVLANRLKKVLPDIIIEHQATFVKDRLISNNILVTFETLHCMKNHKSGNSGFMAFKLDMSKAYDRMEWSFLEVLMQKMGFDKRWIDLIMIYVKTVTYSIIVNGELKGLIHPSKGIKQGNPLSSFLFLMCTEGLHGFIKNATRKGEIKGFSLCRRGSKLTHLFFADDSLLFCRVNPDECNKILSILSSYKSASGQQVNRSKIALFFSKSTPDDIKELIKDLLMVQEIQHYEKHLGLPSLLGKGKKASFNYIKKRVWKKLQ